VRDTVAADLLRHLGHAAVEVGCARSVSAAGVGSQCAKRCQGPAHGAGRRAQFVPHAGLGRQRAPQQGVQRRVVRRGFEGQRALALAHAWNVGGAASALHAQVQGERELGLGCAGFTIIGPGVWPKRKKRARRRLSAV
jgi:hypothetical protein